MIITLQTLVFFRESLLNALDRLLRPYYNKLSLAFGRNAEGSDDEEPDEQVFAEYDEERGVVFYPPMYLQRYAAVSDCLMDEQWCGKLEKVVDLGYHDMSFINYLKEVQGIKCILGVDLESIPLRCSIDLVGCEDYAPKRETPLQVTLFKGNAADPDYRLVGCDAVIAIEMIEHMLPHDLDRLIHTVFGFIKPWIAIFTTPNQDFNVLFKALEKNGLRRLDHFFEWSRDQFHDWCSNIVVRYPDYTVSCKGIGPGPNGTKHLGCCSQMALFVSKDYHKQQDLNLNSLALVSDTPSPHSISNLISSWETSEIPSESHMIEPPKNAESFFELQSEMQSSITLVLTTPSSSQDTILYKDKTSQCNLDSEIERGYLMFDYEQMCFDILKPRKAMNNHRVYEIEDVYNRLNCTTLEVKKFSKTTLNLMAKNKLDTLVHTREVVDEIRHLTKMLNFNKDLNNQLENGTHTWYNINWGDNAPYWNQYYKIVKAYNYPFEVKSDECRILDLVSDEINRLIDMQFDDDFSSEVNKLEIPIEHLMRIVQQITDDVEKVKDLLEWNGYEIRGNYVIHSRLVVDYSSACTQEDDSPTTTDVYSDWDSTSLSDGSTNIADIHARCLHRALDQKVRKLRSMLTADEDITTELDQVVCRLMKLALRTSKGRNTPPPTKWMQCKLLDLLTLTEKTIERRKRHFIESYQLEAINYDEKSQEMIALEKIKEDDTASKIVNKYKHLVNQTDDIRAQYNEIEFDLVDDLSVTSTEFAKAADYEFVDKRSISPTIEPEPDLPNIEIFNSEDAHQDTKLQRTQAWVEEDIEVVPYPTHDGNFDVSSVETDHNVSKFTKYYNKKLKGKQYIDFNSVLRKKSEGRKRKVEVKSKENSRTKLGKKITRKKSFSNGSGFRTTCSKVNMSVDKTHRVKPRRKQYNNLPKYPTVAKPIPISLIELCHPEMMIGSDVEHFHSFTDSTTKADEDKMSSVDKIEIAATEESMLIEIITEDASETIALRRTIGTDADTDSTVLEDETLIRSVSNTLNGEDLFEKHISAENISVHSQTIFLYDINEPTTSKGIRHTAMDVQCGPDTTAPIYSALSATTSLTKVPKMLTAGIKIGDSRSHMKFKGTDFGTFTEDVDIGHKTIIPKNRSVGIKIKDSDSHIIVNRMEFSTASTYSTLSVTPSLAKMPKISATGITASNSESSNRIKNTKFGVGTNTPERDYDTYFPKETLPGIKMKDSTPIITKQLDSTTNELFDIKKDISEVTTIFESSPFVSLSKGSSKNIPVNMECSTSTQELYDKLIVSSQLLFKRDSEILKEPCIEQELKDFSSNPPNRIQCLEQSQDSYSKSNLSPKQILEKPILTKGIQKRSARLQDSVSHIPKRRKWPTIAQKTRSRSVVSVKKMTLKHIPKEKYLLKNPHADPDSKLRTKLPKKLTNTKFYNIPRTPPLPSYSKRTTLTVSKVEEVSIGLEIEDRNLILLEETGHLVEKTEENNRSYVLEAFPKEKNALEFTRELKINNSISEVSETIQNVFEIPNYTICNTKEEIVSPADEFTNNSKRPNAKNVTRNLSSGGVQLHSYKDQQALSEDVMYQGQWRQSKPKVLSRKKGCIPVLFKKNDLNLKKKINAVELNPSNKASTDGKNSHKNVLKQELRQRLLPRNRILTNLKQESDIKESKQNQTHPRTTSAATVAKPFRNILKAPSNFPISILPSNHLKYNTLAKQTVNSALPAKKVEITHRKGLRKNYIPLYLRQKKQNSSNKISKTDLNSAISKIKKSKENIAKSLVKSKAVELKRDLLRLQTKPLQAKYVVLRNEIEQKKSDGQQIKNTPENARRKDVSRQRSSTPTSANSSTGSSPCSISTVRAVAARKKHATSRRHSSASYINNTPTSGSENSTPERSRKFTKQCKSARKNIENKENIPQTSKHFNVSKKDSTKLGKGIYISQKKDVYISKVKDSLQSTANTPSKQKNQKSILNIPTAKSFTDKKSLPLPVSPSNERSAMLDAPLSAPSINDISECAQTSDMVLIIEPQPRQIHNSLCMNEISKLDDINVVNHCSVTKNVDNEDEEVVDSPSVRTVNSTMRALIEETLDFINDSLVDVDKYAIAANTDTISNPENISNSENLVQRLDSSESATSFKTGVTSNDNNEILPIDIEYALNQSFDTTFDVESTLSLNDAHFTVTDFDGFSFKSITSGSRLSGYLSADNEFSSSIKLPKCSITPPTSTSVREIFERKDLPFQPAQNQNQTGALANQVFSGFTINEGPVSGDTPDLVNIVDSETGSILAVANPRQATSEEVLISGRSSESFESCILDDDAVVPNWLFQLISQQAASLDDLDPPPPGESNPIPVLDPLFDENANVVEAPGAGAGAGDGHGIHSDHSQDSSGRGTSLSSSETSSGQQSEVLLIDPAAFAAQFELLRDAVESSVVLAMNNVEGSDNATGSRQVPGVQESEPQPLSAGESRRTPRVVLTSASDADADISSFETDEVPDSSDN